MHHWADLNVAISESHIAFVYAHWASQLQFPHNSCSSFEAFMQQKLVEVRCLA